MGNIRERSASGRSVRDTHAARPERPPSRTSSCGSIRKIARLSACALAAGGLLHALPAQAVEFGSGELQGSFDTTLSHGVTFRTGKRDDSLTGLNSDDGGRNYKRGLVSNTSKVTGELELDYRSFGAFARVNGFIDFENENGDREHRPLSEEAKDLAGKDLEVLDLYVTGAFDAGDTPVDLRLGSHVLNWGESTFIQNGVNVVNPFDVTKLRTPGAELRDALEPVPLVSASVAPTSALSMEGFWQLDWKKTEIDPPGTYFSTNDYVGAGGNRAFFDDPRFSALLPNDRGGGFGPLTPAINADLAVMRATLQAELEQENDLPPGSLAGRVTVPADQKAHDDGFLSVTRSPDREPDDSGQWGFAFRYLAESLNDTEFGFYFLNHHSRLPLVSATYGTMDGYDHGLLAAGAVGRIGPNTRQAIRAAATPAVTQAVTGAVTEQIREGVVEAVPPGTPQSVIDGEVAARLADPATQQQIEDEVGSRVADVVRERIEGVASALAIDRYGKTARYHVEYPEDLRVFGVSFNTLLGASGWALQGEYSFHPDAPLQRTEASLFADGLEPLTAELELGALVAQGNNLDPAERSRLAELSANRQNLRDKLGTRLQGYVERDVSQFQVTATKVFGPAAGSDGGAFITEAAVMHVHDMPDKTAMPLDTGGIGAEIADATSFGYRAAARLDYNNAIGAARLSPYVQLQHDLSGSSPGPSGPFVDGRKVLTLGVGVSYLEDWRGNLGYTMHAGGNNQLGDRDFVAASVSYSF